MNKIIKDPFTAFLPHLDIHGETEATCVAIIESFLKDNIKLHNKKVIIIHGKGKGILRKKTHSILKNNKNIAKYYIDCFNDGQTIIEFK